MPRKPSDSELAALASQLKPALIRWAACYRQLRSNESSFFQADRDAERRAGSFTLLPDEIDARDLLVRMCVVPAGKIQANLDAILSGPVVFTLPSYLAARRFCFLDRKSVV